MDVTAWLRSLGLERYEQAFRTADVDPEVLPELTDADLKELGLPLGARKKLLRAIAALGATDRPRPAAAAAPTARAERRHLTMLFCDLVGSTELSGRLDPEDLSEVIGAYHDCCAKVITRWDGHVARYLGDGVLAYFGYPQAHEDDAERAVRAGLDLTAAVARLRAGDDEPLAARVGIATGNVVVGDRIGEGTAQEEAVVGATPNLASRLQGLAAPGTVVVAASTRRLVGALFDLADLGPVDLKGFPEPVVAFRVVGEGHAEGRFEALRGGRLTPLVGREHELGMVLERWAWAKEGHGQVVMIQGEPGIGKSRMVRALRDRLAGEPHIALSHFCSPYHTNTALNPIITQLERAAGLAPDDAPAAKAAKLRALLGQATDRLDDAVPLIADLLGIPRDGRPPGPNLSPQQQKQRTFEVLTEQLEGLVRKHPVLEVYEDVHWADPTSLELLDLLVDRARRLPVLVVLTFRPEFTPPWLGQTHVTSLPLNRLGRPQAAAMVARLTGDKALPAEVVEPILDRTDGVPLLVEELTATVLESGLLRDRGSHWELDGHLLPLAIPGSLHDSLMARLDRLGPAKTVAQIAAVLGHSFDMATLQRLWDGSAETLRRGLDSLVDESLVIRWGVDPHAHFVFKHALIAEVAYESLLRQDRRAYHARAAEILSLHAADLVRLRPEVVARHHSAAGEERKGFDAWLAAARAATRRSANMEALGHLRSAESDLVRLEKRSDRRFDDLWAALHMARAPVLIALYGWAVPEVEQAYRSALVLSERTGALGRDLFNVWRGLYNVYLLRGDLVDARDVAERLHVIAGEADDRELHLGSHRALGLCDFLAGRFQEAHRHLDMAIGLYDPERHRHLAVLEGTDPAVIAHSLNAWSLWFLGRSEQAMKNSARAIAAARRAEHPFSLSYAYCLASSLMLCRGEAAEAVSLADAALKLSAEHAFSYWHAWASMVRGRALMDLGEPDIGLRTLEDGLDRYAATEAAQMRGYGLSLLAEAHQRAGAWAESARMARQAIEGAERTGITFYLAESCRLHGQALCHLDPASPAGTRMLLRAVRLADRQGARPLLLRASLALLEQSGRARLRSVVLARATDAIRDMQRSGGVSELEPVQRKLDEAAADVAVRAH